MFEKIVESCRFLLKNYPEAQGVKSYLDSRLNQESQDLFQFGYFPNTDNIQVLSDLVGEDQLLKEELLYYKYVDGSQYVEDSLFPRRFKFCHFEHHPLMMPFRDPYGTIVGLVCRTLLPESEWKSKKISKYKNTKGFEKGHCLFGLYENKQHILDQNSVYIVEGQFDVIKAMEVGFRNIVAIGNNIMTPYQFSVISRYTNNIFLLLDNDEAGQKGRKRTLDKFGQLANIRNFYVPESFKDIDEYITKDQISDYADLSFVVKD
jgi:DNA primase catalytic core